MYQKEWWPLLVVVKWLAQLCREGLQLSAWDDASCEESLGGARAPGCSCNRTDRCGAGEMMEEHMATNWEHRDMFLGSYWGREARRKSNCLSWGTVLPERNRHELTWTYVGLVSGASSSSSRASKRSSAWVTTYIDLPMQTPTSFMTQSLLFFLSGGCGFLWKLHVATFMYLQLSDECKAPELLQNNQVSKRCIGSATIMYFVLTWEFIYIFQPWFIYCK